MKILSFINGEEVEGEETLKIMKGSEVFELSLLGKGQTGEVVDTAEAYAADPLDPKTLVEVFRRAADLMEKRKDEYVKTLIKETFKTDGYARGEVDAAIARLRMSERELSVFDPVLIDGDKGYHTEGKIAYVVREPYGVMLAITPFNYPLLAAVLKVVPGLLAGNSVILKPSVKTPLSSVMLAEDMVRAGLAPEALSVVIMRGMDMDSLLEDRRIRLVSFTGSARVGWDMQRRYPNKKYILELGGKGNALVLDSEDAEGYAREICAGAFKFSGQRCDALSRVIILEDDYERVRDAILTEAKEYTRESGRIVPLIDREAFQRAKELVDEALSKGARVIYKGKEDEGSNLMEPIILENVKPDMRIYYEEVFGPVLILLKVDSEETAVAVANDNRYGLDSAVFCRDPLLAMRVAQALEDGEVTINAHPAHGIAYFPYGGHKDSGTGREGIFVSVREMTQEKTIVMKKGDVERIKDI